MAKSTKPAKPNGLAREVMEIAGKVGASHDQLAAKFRRKSKWMREQLNAIEVEGRHGSRRSGMSAPGPARRHPRLSRQEHLPCATSFLDAVDP
jgi:hypothetical protein